MELFVFEPFFSSDIVAPLDATIVFRRFGMGKGAKREATHQQGESDKQTHGFFHSGTPLMHLYTDPFCFDNCYHSTIKKPFGQPVYPPVHTPGVPYRCQLRQGCFEYIPPFSLTPDRRGCLAGSCADRGSDSCYRQGERNKEGC